MNFDKFLLFWGFTVKFDNLDNWVLECFKS